MKKKFVKSILLSVAAVIVLSVVPATAKQYMYRLGERHNLDGYNLIYTGLKEGICFLKRDHHQEMIVELRFTQGAHIPFYNGNRKFIFKGCGLESFVFEDPSTEDNESSSAFFE